MQAGERKCGSHASAKGLARACGGAFVFGFPLLMTMEMWWLGFTMDRLRLALLVLAALPLLYRLSFRSGFNKSLDWRENLCETSIAYAVGWTMSALMLLIFGVIRPGMPADEWIGKITLQAVCASMGAVLARSLFSGEDEQGEDYRYGPDLLLAAAGAIFLSITVAPTEEMILIAYKMEPREGVVLLVLSLAVAHGFAHATDAKRQRTSLAEVATGQVFLRSTVVFYAIALSLSAYILWSFGQLDNLAPEPALMATVVLGFPASLGASAARLLL